MNPILYNNENKRLCRLLDCIDCKVAEERNGIFEMEFSYPVEGINFDKIQLGDVVEAITNNSDNLQKFDIVSSTKPINGIVTFHGVHISYRLNKVTASGTDINSLTDALTMLSTGTPSNPFTFEADFEASGYMSAADGVPRTVRSMLGGVEGSILDTYGGEFEFDNFAVRLHESRGERRSFPIRYGVNLVDYNEEVDTSESFTGVIPFWKNEVSIVKGSVVDSGGSSLSGRTEIIPLDCSDKFENEPTASQLESYAQTYLSSSRPYLPKQTINVDFVNLADTLEYKDIAPLLDYKLCDTVPVSFPMYGTEADFKIVKTVYDVLAERYTEMELGQLSTTLSEALGINQGGATSGSSGVHIVETGTNGIWSYRKWSDGTAECWGIHRAQLSPYSSVLGGYAFSTGAIYYPTNLFTVGEPIVTYSAYIGAELALTGTMTGSPLTNITLYAVSTANGTRNTSWFIKAIGRWK